MSNKQKEFGLSEWKDLDRTLCVLVAVLSICVSFCLLRAVVRGVTMFSVAGACAIPDERIWESVQHYNEELRAGNLSACEVACTKLFSESASAIVAVLVGGGLIVAALRARYLAKALFSKSKS